MLWRRELGPNGTMLVRFSERIIINDEDNVALSAELRSNNTTKEAVLVITSSGPVEIATVGTVHLGRHVFGLWPLAQPRSGRHGCLHCRCRWRARSVGIICRSIARPDASPWSASTWPTARSYRFCTQPSHVCGTEWRHDLCDHGGAGDRQNGIYYFWTAQRCGLIVSRPFRRQGRGESFMRKKEQKAVLMVLLGCGATWCIAGIMASAAKAIRFRMAPRCVLASHPVAAYA